MLYKNSQEVAEATKQWIRENKELYEYCSGFEHKMIEDNKVRK